MAFTSEDLAALDAAIASGKLRVRHGTREIEYHSISAMKEARALIVSELQRAEEIAQGRRRPTCYRTRINKGL